MSRAAAILAAALLGGCASFSEDGGFGGVGEAVRGRTGAEARWVRSDADAAAVVEEVRRLLAGPLGPEQAVRIALLNNRGLQAAYAEIGISEAERVQAGRWLNPGFSYGRLRRGDELEIERKLIFSLLDLFTLPRRSEIAEQRLEAVRLEAAAQSVRVAAEARRAWFETVAAAEAARYFEDARSAAEAGAELAERMARIGNYSRLQRMREQSFYAEAAAQLARARHEVVATRERLMRVLGLAGDEGALRLPARLPALPERVREAAPLEATALRERLDVRAAMQAAESLSGELGLAGATRFVNVLELGLARNSEAPKPVQRGWEIELRLPIFDSGDARLAAARHRYLRAVHRAAEVAVRARSELREAYAGYRTAYDLAKHYRDEIVPLRKRISEENLQRYNGMLIGVFELIADSRDSMAAVAASIGALREFWLAEGRLRIALTGTSMEGGVAMKAAMPAPGAGGGH